MARVPRRGIVSTALFGIEPCATSISTFTAHEHFQKKTIYYRQGTHMSQRPRVCTSLCSRMYVYHSQVGVLHSQGNLDVHHLLRVSCLTLLLVRYHPPGQQTPTIVYVL